MRYLEKSLLVVILATMSPTLVAAQDNVLQEFGTFPPPPSSGSFVSPQGGFEGQQGWPSSQGLPMQGNFGPNNGIPQQVMPGRDGMMTGGFNGGPGRGQGEMMGGQQMNGDFMMDAQNQGLSRAKEGVHGQEQAVKSLKRIISQLKSKNIAYPKEYDEAISALESAMAIIKDAGEWGDSVEEAVGVLQDRGETLHEMGPRLHALLMFPRIVKDVERQVKQIRKELARAKTAASKSGADVSAISQKIETEVASVEGYLSGLKTRMGAIEDFEDVMDDIRENIFEKFEDLRDDVRILLGISNAAKVLKEVDAEIKRLDRTLARLKGQKKDVATFSELINQMKAKRVEAAEVMKRGVDPEEMFDIMSEGERLHNDALEEAARLENRKTDTDRQLESLQSAVYRASSLSNVYTSFLR